VGPRKGQKSVDPGNNSAAKKKKHIHYTTKSNQDRPTRVDGIRGKVRRDSSAIVFYEKTGSE